MTFEAGKAVKFVGKAAKEKYHADFQPYYGLDGVIHEVDDALYSEKYGYDIFSVDVQFEDGNILSFRRDELRII